MLNLITIFLFHPVGDSSSLHGFVKKSGREILQNSSRQGLRSLPTWLAKIVPNNLFAFPPSVAVIGKGREQDAEAFSSSDSLSFRHMEVLNAENAGAIFPATPRFSTKSVLN